jgi:hypothetical protein
LKDKASDKVPEGLKARRSCPKYLGWACYNQTSRTTNNKHTGVFLHLKLLRLYFEISDIVLFLLWPKSLTRIRRLNLPDTVKPGL